MASELLIAAISKSLDGLALRQTVIAQNIANANSSSYVPLTVNFEAELASAVKAAKINPESVAMVRALRPSIEQDPLAVVDEPMRVDQQIAASSSTAMRYAALVSILDRVFQIRNVALSAN